MIGACEKQKLVYVLNRDTAASLTISSPLEAHKSHTLCFALTALDMGFDNPVFASIELDYAEVDADPTGEAAQDSQKLLVRRAAPLRSAPFRSVPLRSRAQLAAASGSAPNPLAALQTRSKPARGGLNPLAAA